MYTIGTRLKEIRLQKKLTQKQFACLAGTTVRALQRYEAGDRKPSFEVILSILDNVGVSADYLLGRTDIMSGSEPKSPEKAGNATGADAGNPSENALMDLERCLDEMYGSKPASKEKVEEALRKCREIRQIMRGCQERQETNG